MDISITIYCLPALALNNQFSFKYQGFSSAEEVDFRNIVQHIEFITIFFLLFFFNFCSPEPKAHKVS